MKSLSKTWIEAGNKLIGPFDSPEEAQNYINDRDDHGHDVRNWKTKQINNSLKTENHMRIKPNYLGALKECLHTELKAQSDNFFGKIAVIFKPELEEEVSKLSEFDNTVFHNCMRAFNYLTMMQLIMKHNLPISFEGPDSSVIQGLITALKYTDNPEIFRTVSSFVECMEDSINLSEYPDWRKVLLEHKLDEILTESRTQLKEQLSSVSGISF